jgi:nucleolar protein 4
LFISNLPYTATSTDVKTLFSDIAPVRNAFVVLEHGSGVSKGVGYVSFAIKEDAQLALAKISAEGLIIDGRSIRAQWAEKKPKDGTQTSEAIGKPRPAPKHPPSTSRRPNDPLAIRTVVISGFPPSVDAKSLWKKIRKYEGADKVEWPLKSETGEDFTSGIYMIFSL